jgi:23S rRNA (guanine745-N1)-methyltransferase
MSGIHLRCPVCRGDLTDSGATYRCPAGHAFDVAADGHVNLLLSAQRRSREPGDSREMVRSRRAFLDAGYYDAFAAALAAAVARVVPAHRSVVVDAGCGEGFFTRAVRASTDASAEILGVDVSKAAIVYAARRDKRSLYVVASAFDLPVFDASVDVVVSNFAPADGPELARVVRPGGHVVTGHPGRNHLFALRSLVYDRPEPHEPKEPLRHHADLFERVGSDSVRAPVELASGADTANLLAMTPYYWQADAEKQARIAALPGLSTELDVLITTYRRR